MTGLAAIAAAGTALLYPAVRSILIAEFDSALAAKARALTRLPEPGREGINLAFTQRILSDYQPSEAPEYFQVWSRDGSVFARSPSLEGTNLLCRVGPESKPAFWNLTLPDGRPGRAIGIGFATERESGSEDASKPDPAASQFTVSMVFARDTVRLHGVLQQLSIGIAVGGVLLFALIAWVVRIGTNAALKPVHDLAAQVKAIDAATLKAGFSTQTLPEELQPIGDQLKRMLDRLNAAFERERRFAGNAAHELLTPIAELRSMAEAAQLWKADPEATAQFADDTLETAKQMEHLVAHLLALARAETDMALARLETVDLAALLEEVRLCFHERILAKRLQIDWQVPKSVPVLVDRVLCKSVCFNLLDNALEYTPEHGKIWCRLESSLSPQLRLRNTMEPHLAPDLDHIFEPLWRKDKARSNRVHAGLGLTLARAFARAFHAEISARTDTPNEFEVRVKFSRS